MSVLLMAHNAHADQHDWQNERKLMVLFGLTQPLLLNGFNVEGVYMHERLVFAYSHGASLDFTGDLLPDSIRDQQVEVFLPFSTGFGIGYRITEWLNARVEAKWHRFEFYYEGDSRQSDNRITADANNFSLGVGVYGYWQPFRQSDNYFSGITLAPSVRYWPTVTSDLDDGFTYDNERTGESEELESLAAGIGFTPLIVNLSVGYSF